ncbi:unnamed protein product [Musa banksii]
MALRGGVLCPTYGLPNPLPSNRSRRNAGMRLVSSTTAAAAGHQKRPQNVEGEFFGSVCLYHKPLEVLFTGDHLASSEQSLLEIGEFYNRQSVSLQSRSVRKLLDIGFVWILPGHGRRIAFRDNQEKILSSRSFLG